MFSTTTKLEDHIIEEVVAGVEVEEVVVEALDGDGVEEEVVGINGDVEEQNLAKAREEEEVEALIKPIEREFSTRRIIS